MSAVPARSVLSAPATGPARATTAPRARVRALVRDLLADIAADEDERWGGGSISPSAYETAWVALVRDPEETGRLAFPEALAWLLRNQRDDGGWGPPFPHDIIPSMAALLALRRAPDPPPDIEAAITRGRRYLTRTLRRWRADMVDTPFFEFLIPRLADALAECGVRLTIPDRDVMLARREAKLRRLPREALYSGASSLLHALEVFGPDLDFECLYALRAPNGGYGYSPSATAAALLHAPEWDGEAARWLGQLVAGGAAHTGGMPTSHPADAFEGAWALHLLLHGGVPLDPATNPSLRRILRWLHASLAGDGASFARMRALPCDADDTALVIGVLNRLGIRVAPDPLWAFERPDHFVSYEGERTASVSSNAHVLEALLSVDAVGLPGLAARRDKVVRYVLAERSADGSWIDKWHISPYYGTLSCALALARMPDPTTHAELLPALDWLERTQRPGGGWGTARATLEETAYGVLIVVAAARVLPGVRTPAMRRLVRRAEGYLLRHRSGLERPAALPTLWVDKTLYAPARVIRAGVLAALYACRDERVWEPDGHPAPGHAPVALVVAARDGS